MKIKGLFSALSLASALVLAACGGGGGDDSGGAAGELFNIQGTRTVQATSGGVTSVTATAVSQVSSTGLTGSWSVAGGSTLLAGDTPSNGRFRITNADCTENAQSGTGPNPDNLPIVGRFTCTVFLELPAITRASETINLTFQGSDPEGNAANSTFTVNVAQAGGGTVGGPVQLNVITRTATGDSQADSVSVQENSTGSFRITAQGNMTAISGATVSQLAGPAGVVLQNADCAVATVANGQFDCTVGFTTPTTVTNFTTFEYQIQATDARGSSAAQTVALVVSPANAGALTAAVGSVSDVNNPIRFEPGSQRQLQCFSSGGVGPFTYRWTVARPATNPGAPELDFVVQSDQASRTSTATIVFPDTEVQGTYVATCTVTDANNQSVAAPSVFFELERALFFLQVSPASQTQAFVGGETINLAASILGGNQAPVGDPQNYSISFKPSDELVNEFNFVAGTGVNYSIVTPSFTGSTTRVFSVQACAARDADVPMGETDICNVAQSAKITYTFKVQPTDVANEPATVAAASLVSNTSVFATGDTVRFTAAGTRVVNGASLDDVFYYWVIDQAGVDDGLVFQNSRQSESLIVIPDDGSIVSGMYTATVFTSLVNTNSATPPPANQSSMATVRFTVDGNRVTAVSVDAGMAEVTSVAANNAVVYSLSGVGTTIDNQPVSAAGDVPNGFNASWALVDVRDPSTGNLLVPQPTVTITNDRRFNASVTLNVAGVYTFDLIVFEDGDITNVADRAEREAYADMFPTRRANVTKQLIITP